MNPKHAPRTSNAGIAGPRPQPAEERAAARDRAAKSRPDPYGDDAPIHDA